MFGTKNVKERELIDIFLLKTQGLQLDGRLDIPVLDQPIKVKGQNLMSRFFYVDATNGDDTNNGSSMKPFKRLKKAVDSTPMGAFVYIDIVNDYELADEDDVINFTGKNVYINLNGHTLSKTNTSKQFICARGIGSLTFANGNINISSGVDTSTIYTAALVNIFDTSSAVIFGDFTANLVVNTDTPVVNVDRAICFGGAANLTMTATGNQFSLGLINLFRKADATNDKTIIYDRNNVFNSGTSISN